MTRQEVIVEMLGKRGLAISAKEVAQTVERPIPSVRRDLVELHRLGLVNRTKYCGRLVYRIPVHASQ